jgi:hypothetical protein
MLVGFRVIMTRTKEEEEEDGDDEKQVNDGNGVVGLTPGARSRRR